MNHMMIDLETLDTQASTVVVSIGACVFDNEKIIRTGYWVLDIDEQIKKGRTISGNTIEWWMNQSDMARSVFAKNVTKVPMDVFASEFFNFFGEEKLHMWGNGADFDLSIMIDLWKRHQLPAIKKWSYSNHMCFRTMQNIYDIKKGVERKGTHHNALDDAIFQAECLINWGHL